MSYFSKIPLTTYNFNNKTSVVKDILRRAAFLSEVLYKDVYTVYTVQDGETPELVALETYGAATYHWVVLLFNEIHNPYFDWPINQISLEYYCTKKYGLDTDGQPIMFKVKHYEYNDRAVGEITQWTHGVTYIHPQIPLDLEGNIIQLAYPVTFYEYEQQLNDEKRIIKLLKPELLGTFIRQFEASINV